MSARKRYAIVGTGGRAKMYIFAIAGYFREHADLVGMCDLSQVRMNYYNQELKARFGMDPRPTYRAEEFDRMIAETKPDVVIVCTIDCTHHQYIARAMELGCDVITEKPMTIDAAKARAIFDAIDRTGHTLRVTFNYRYAPTNTTLREVIRQGAVGRPLHVDFSWVLDTRHGADYFRRWHREKDNSGGLLVHKATHHFDLVNWWIHSYPADVFAMGELKFYGADNARARGEHYSYARYTGEPDAARDPFGVFLDRDDTLRRLYLDAEPETGYIRDRNVFGEPITIEDTINVTARYRSGVLLSYALVAYAPWEGYKVSITGTKGRVELENIEAVGGVTWLNAEEDRRDPAEQARLDSFKYKRLRVFPMFGVPYDVDIPEGIGDHGGGDVVLLNDIFLPNPPPDPLKRAASHIDGAASILLGISANESLRTGRLVHVNDLFPLPDPGEG